MARLAVHDHRPAGASGCAGSCIAILVFAVFMHFVAYWMVGRYADAPVDTLDAGAITASVLLSWLLMISQAMESMTRAFYSRSDLDLILASPVAAQRLFAVRIATVAVSVAMMAMPLAAPFIDVLIVRGGLRWLGAYGLIVAMGAAAAALAVGFTVALFRIIGPKRTRLVAQVVAAVIGAAFVIGLQVAAILSYGTISRIACCSPVPRWRTRPISAALFGGRRALRLGDWPCAHRRARREFCAASLPPLRCVCAALRRICDCGGRRRRIPASATAGVQSAFQKPSPRRALAPQGMDAAAARPVAGVADADADALSDSARRAAVAQFRRRQRRL